MYVGDMKCIYRHTYNIINDVAILKFSKYVTEIVMLQKYTGCIHGDAILNSLFSLTVLIQFIDCSCSGTLHSE